MQNSPVPGPCAGEFLLLPQPTGCLPWPHLPHKGVFLSSHTMPRAGEGGGCPSRLFPNPRGDPSRNPSRSQSRGSLSPLPRGADTRDRLRERLGREGLGTAEESQLGPVSLRGRESSRQCWWSPPVRGFSTSNPGDHPSFHSLFNMRALAVRGCCRTRV